MRWLALIALFAFALAGVSACGPKKPPKPPRPPDVTVRLPDPTVPTPHAPATVPEWVGDAGDVSAEVVCGGIESGLISPAEWLDHLRASWNGDATEAQAQRIAALAARTRSLVEQGDGVRIEDYFGRTCDILDLVP